MNVEQALRQRANEQCELCAGTDELAGYLLPPDSVARVDNSVLLCGTCQGQVASSELDGNHWRCLNDSMWSQEPAVQVMAYRMLKRLSSETWAQDLLEMLYLDEDTQKWADRGLAELDAEPTLDVNGVALQAGDNVVLIKDLDVKGAGFIAKRGTAVRGISLSDNVKHIEGRVNGQRIVIIAEYVKKS